MDKPKIKDCTHSKVADRTVFFCGDWAMIEGAQEFSYQGKGLQAVVYLAESGYKYQFTSPPYMFFRLESEHL